MLSSCHIFVFLLSRINSQIIKLIPTCSVQCCSGRSFWVCCGEVFFLIYPQGCLTITIPHFISSQKKPHNYFPFLSSHTSTVCQYFSGIVHDLVCLGSFSSKPSRFNFIVALSFLFISNTYYM